MNIEEKKYNLIKFEDGDIILDVRVSPDEETVWLTQKEMALLFNVSTDNIGLHVKNILRDGELDQSVYEESSVTASDGKKYKTKLYNLDMIISVGYRVKSKRGILFRKWANSILKQYLLNGYAINNKRCIDCQENIIALNNKVNNLIESTTNLNNRMLSLESTDNILSNMLFYENNIFEAYSYIKKLLLSAKKEIIIIDGYIDITVLDVYVKI